MNDNNPAFSHTMALQTYVCKVAPLSFEEKEELRTRIITETSNLPPNKD